MYNKASWAGPTAATALVTGGAWRAQPLSWDSTLYRRLALLRLLTQSPLKLVKEAVLRSQHLSQDEGGRPVANNKTHDKEKIC